MISAGIYKHAELEVPSGDLLNKTLKTFVTSSQRDTKLAEGYVEAGSQTLERQITLFHLETQRLLESKFSLCVKTTKPTGE